MFRSNLELEGRCVSVECKMLSDDGVSIRYEVVTSLKPSTKSCLTTSYSHMWACALGPENEDPAWEQAKEHIRDRFEFTPDVDWKNENHWEQCSWEFEHFMNLCKHHHDHSR